jgi:hypothetical protein
LGTQLGARYSFAACLERLSHRKIVGKKRRTLSHEEICLKKGEFSPKRAAIWIFGSGRVKGSPIPDLRRQRRSGARLRGKQEAAVHR